MGKIISEGTGEEITVEDGSPIREACKQLGVPFGCENGECGLCQIEVSEGKENLSEMNDKEKMFSDDDSHRLACQCKLKHGEVRINF